MYTEEINIKRYNGVSRYLTLLILALLMQSFTAFAIDKKTYASAKARLVKTIKTTNIDLGYSKIIDHFYFKTCDSLVKAKVKIENRPIMDILSRFFDVSDKEIKANHITPLGIPLLNHNFLLTIKASRTGSVNSLYMGINFTHSKILLSVFEGLSLADSIGNMVGLKEMYYEPYYISSRIELKKFEPYKDTLLYLLANVAPEILNKKIADNNEFYTTLVDKSNNISVRAVSRVKVDKDFDKMLPFSLAILENRITEEDVKKLVLIPKDYYHAFVQEAISLHTNGEPEVSRFLKRPIEELNKKIGNYYFIKQINDLHESPDNIRFNAINSLDATDLYFLLLAGSYDLVMEGSSALYTSSFMYVYKKFLKETEEKGLNKFFDDIGYYRFNTFISNVSDYGLVADLVSNLKTEKVANYIGIYLERLPDKQLSDNEIILDAMSIAEIFNEIRNDQDLRTSLIKRIEQIQKRPELQNHFLFQRMYNVFKEILLDKYKYETDFAYDILPVKRLQPQNTIVQACFYYDDEDAGSSFNNSTASFDAKLWSKEDKGNYIVFSSKAGNSMKVYMNKPNTKAGCDSAQNELLQAIDGQGYEISSFIHRGHSYHLSKSISKISPSCQFVFLGSCGGYKEVLKIFQLNPNVNIISTRSVGSKLINDPILTKINSNIVNDKDLKWDELWKEFDAKFQGKLEKDLFSAYTAPNKYMGIKFIRRVYGY